MPGLEFGHLERLLGVIYAPKVATELSPGVEWREDKSDFGRFIHRSGLGFSSGLQP